MKFNHRSLRDHIAQEAARLLYERQESEYPRAKRRAARSIGVRFRPDQLPSNREVRDQLRRIEASMSNQSIAVEPRMLMLEAVRVMRILKEHQPRLNFETSQTPNVETKATIFVGTVDWESVVQRLAADRLSFRLQNQETHIAARLTAAGLPLEIVFDSELDGIDLETAERLFTEDTSIEDFEAELEGIDPSIDRFEAYLDLLRPLDEVRQDPKTHPEGDVLYHSLQVFELAEQEYSFDEEFLTAALLHDVGKGFSGEDPSRVTRRVLQGIVTHRTLWLIENLPKVKLLSSRQLDSEEAASLRKSEDFDDLLKLHELDVLGRRSGVQTRSLEEAIDLLRELDHSPSDFER